MTVLSNFPFSFETFLSSKRPRMMGCDTSRRPTPRYARRRRRRRRRRERSVLFFFARVPILTTTISRRSVVRPADADVRMDACDLFRRAGGPAGRDRSLSLCDTRTTRATGFDAVKRDETMRENVMFFPPRRVRGSSNARRRATGTRAARVRLPSADVDVEISSRARGKRDGIFFVFEKEVSDRSHLGFVGRGLTVCEPSKKYGCMDKGYSFFTKQRKI